MPPSKTSPKTSASDIGIHPLLSRLLSHGTAPCVFRGYVGPSDNEGSIRLYPNLGVLNFSIEIVVKDIVETAPAPRTLLPHDGTILWVRADADVVFHGDTVSTVPVRTLCRPRAAIGETSPNLPPSQSAGYVDLGGGRLQISVPAARGESRDERDVCACPCRGCASCTSVCQSGPA